MRLALLSFWHVHAADYAREAEEHPETELVAIWDELPERGRLEATARGVPFIEDLGSVLGDPTIDGVIVTTATTVHGAIFPAAARAGKHVFVEKVIAPTLRESIAIVDAVRDAGVTITVALSRAEAAPTAAIRNLIAAGRIGQPTSSRIRFAHDGALPTPERPDGWLPVRFYDRAESGGGAMIDLGAHPLYLTRFVLGLPEAVIAVSGDVTGRGVDDNAAAIFRYRNGAIGIAETSFVSGAPGSAMVVTGTKGSVRYMDGAGHIELRDPEPARIPIAGPAPAPFPRWVEAVRTGTPMDDNLRLALELSALTEAAARSAAAGRAVRLDELDGWPLAAAAEGGPTIVVE